MAGPTGEKGKEEEEIKEKSSDNDGGVMESGSDDDGDWLLREESTVKRWLSINMTCENKVSHKPKLQETPKSPLVHP